MYRKYASNLSIYATIIIKRRNISDLDCNKNFQLQFLITKNKIVMFLKTNGNFARFYSTNQTILKLQLLIRVLNEKKNNRYPGKTTLTGEFAP
jgi:hypothetical protein